MAHDMVFNSVVFLFCFMPLALLLYYLAPGRAKNAVLLLESILFYCWAGITWLPLIAVLVLVNYLAGLFLGRRQAGGRRLVLVLAVVVSAAATFPTPLFISSTSRPFSCPCTNGMPAHRSSFVSLRQARIAATSSSIAATIKIISVSSCKYKTVFLPERRLL